MIYVNIMTGLFVMRFALQKSIRNSALVYYLVLIALFLFSAFRFEVGCDWTNYHDQFEAVGFMSFAEVLGHAEVIWWSVLYVLNVLEITYPAANVLSSAVFFYGVNRLAVRQPDRFAFIVLLFPILIVNMPMSGIRQGAAIGLMCVAYNAFVDRRVVHFVIWTILAAGFHASAMVFLLLAPIASGQYTRKRLVQSGILAVPGAIILVTGELGQEAASRYVNSGLDAAGAVFRVGMLVITGLYFILYLRPTWMARFPKDYSLVSIGSIAMVLCAAALPISTVIGDRFGYYLVPIQCMIFARLPYLPLRSKQTNVAMPYIGLILVFVVWTFLSFLFQECYLPYRTWLFGFPENKRFGIDY